MENLVGKQVELDLVGLDGNASALLGYFRRAARREGWTPEEIDKVVKEATSNDYNHLLMVLMEHTK